MPTSPPSTPPTNHAITRPPAPFGWMTAPRTRPPQLQPLPNTAPTEALILARLEGLRQRREQYERDVKFFQYGPGEDSLRPGGSGQDLQGRVTALEGQMASLRAEADGRCPMLLTALEANLARYDSLTTQAVSSLLDEGQDGHLDPALTMNGPAAVAPRLLRLVKLSELIMQRVNRRVAEFRRRQAEQDGEIRRLRELNRSYSDARREESVHRDELAAAFAQFMDKSRREELRSDCASEWLRREAVGGTSTDPVTGPSATRCDSTDSSDRRAWLSSTLSAERDRPSIETQRRTHADNDATATSDSPHATRSGSPPHHKRKRDPTDAGDHFTPTTHPRKRIDLLGRSAAAAPPPPPPWGTTVSRPHLPDDVSHDDHRAGTLLLAATGRDVDTVPGSHQGGLVPNGTGRGDEETGVTVRLPVLGKRRWEHSMLRRGGGFKLSGGG